MTAAPPVAGRRRSRTRYAVLGMLGLGLETGYAMKRHVEGELSHFWQESYGQIYPVLRQLEAEGLVRRRPGLPPSGSRRNAYALTRNGRAELRAWLAEPPELPPPRMELLLKLWFGEGAEPDVCIRHVRAHRELCSEDLRLFDALEPRAEARAESHSGVAYGLITLRYGRLLREAEVRWCDETLVRLERLEGKAASGRRRRMGGARA